ncbi:MULTISPECIES: VOC family protein [unclassified Amycolatopsis]|uniref:VOC family protein n=1 Tax=unclassified Amycolatopsis TaxID=2618356 RepID=UPI0005C26237|nr:MULTISPECIES: VOC family protein [unclassified Amycolatopsis]
MTSYVDNITVDCADPWALAQFWTKVTGRPVGEDDRQGDPEIGITLDSGVTLLFIAVPETKTVKNRMHLCLAPDDGTRDEEVDRLLKLGATLHSDHRRDDGTGWAVLQDPEGNEFCVLRSAAEKA